MPVTLLFITIIDLEIAGIGCLDYPFLTKKCKKQGELAFPDLGNVYGLWDSWEVGVINGVDLKALGASPLHKDVFVQMDFMSRTSAANTLGPNQNVIAGIEQAFANAPVDNPDHVPGINIHLILGNEVPYQEDLRPVMTAFTAIKDKYFDPLKGSVFHYMIWANGYDGGDSSGNAFQIVGSDFVVSLGLWNDNQGGTDEQKIGTFIHELGHNLGLQHGDTEDINFKPNHLSVMNYAYQVTGIMRNNKNYFTYQPFDLPALDENNLSEPGGLSAPAKLAGYHITYLTPARTTVDVPADGPIDWNFSGKYDPGTVRADINGDIQYSVLAATPEEWTRINYKGGDIGKLQQFAGLVQNNARRYNRVPLKELTQKDFQTIKKQ